MNADGPFAATALGLVQNTIDTTMKLGETLLPFSTSMMIGQRLYKHVFARATQAIMKQ